MPFELRECCCGCSVRTGTQILIWITLVVSAIAIVGEIALFQVVRDSIFAKSHDVLAFTHLFYFLAIFGAEMGAAIAALYGVQEGFPRLVKGFYYLRCYNLVYSILLVLILLMTSIELYIKFIPSFLLLGVGGVAYNIPAAVVGSIFNIALQGYFLVVVKSYISYVEQNGDTDPIV